MIHDSLRAIIAFVFVLGVLVTIHEFGHYLAARWRGIHVEIFSIGFGPALVRWADRSGTEWRICCLPFGGYVLPHGMMNPETATPEERAVWIPGKTFHEKSVWSRAAVIVAGPLFNFLLSIVLLACLYSVTGMPRITNHVSTILPHSAAADAGLEKGDVITGIGGHSLDSVAAIQEEVSVSPGLKTTLSVTRDGNKLEVPVTIGSGTAKSGGSAHGLLGVGFMVEKTPPLALPQAVIAGIKETWSMTKETVRGLWMILTGQHSARELGGPLKIAQLSGQVAQYGFASLLPFMALLSVNLGLINLFPIPVLDGGKLIFYIVEAVRGRPVPVKVQEVCFQFGLAAVAALFLFSTFNDLSSFGLFKWITSFVS